MSMAEMGCCNRLCMAQGTVIASAVNYVVGGV
jgi:hypothetical protein